MASLTERLYVLMKKKGIKAVDLAAAVSVNTSTISRILNGTQMPATDTLYKFAQYFNVSMEYLFSGETGYVSADTSQNELRLLEYYNQMNKDDQEELLMIAQMKANKEKRGSNAKSSPLEADSASFETA